MKIPLVSVLMVTFNRERHVREGINAILSQTMDDYELIIVDDSSTDGTWGIIMEFSSHPKIHMHRNPVNLGEYANRNFAAKLAKGKYLKYCDAEDILYPHCLRIMAANMEFFPDAGVGMCREEDIRFVYPKIFSPQEVYRLQYLGKSIMGRGLPDVIIRHDAFFENGGFDPRYRAADYALWMKICRKWSFIAMVSGLAWGRAHAGQSTQVLIENGLLELENLILARELFSKNPCPLDPTERDLAFDRVKRRFFRKVAKFALTGNIQKASYLLRQSGLSMGNIVDLRNYAKKSIADREIDQISMPDWRSYYMENIPGNPDKTE